MQPEMPPLQMLFCACLAASVVSEDHTQGEICLRAPLPAAFSKAVPDCSCACCLQSAQCLCEVYHQHVPWPEHSSTNKRQVMAASRLTAHATRRCTPITQTACAADWTISWAQTHQFLVGRPMLDPANSAAQVRPGCLPLASYTQGMRLQTGPGP